MAAGDKWDLGRSVGAYVSDDGDTYRYRGLTAYHSQAGLGWVDAAAGNRLKVPKGLKPRSWIMLSSDTPPLRRRVVVATNTAYAAGVVGTTTLNCYHPTSNDEQVFTLGGKEGERHRG